MGFSAKVGPGRISTPSDQLCQPCSTGGLEPRQVLLLAEAACEQPGGLGLIINAEGLSFPALLVHLGFGANKL